MSAGWQVGDLALCVEPDKWEMLWDEYSGPYPEAGGVYRVNNIFTHDEKLFLILDDFEDGAWHSVEFRKIKPDTEAANADDAAWLKDLLAKPKVRA